DSRLVIDGRGRALAGAALALVALALAACERSPQAGGGAKPPSVTVVEAAQRRVPVYGQYVGQTDAVKTVEVRARVEGFIERQGRARGGRGHAGARGRHH